MKNEVLHNNLIRYTPWILVIINFCFKLIYISSNSIAGDEPFSIYYAQGSVFSIIQQLSTGNNPPLYEIILHFWIKIFGISEISVRFPSVLFSSFTAYYIYKIGIKNFSFSVAFIASILFTFSNFHIIFSHEARVYSLFALLTTVSMHIFLNVYKSATSIKQYLPLLVVNLLLIYAHYFGFFIIFIQSIFVVLIKEMRIKMLTKYFYYLLGLILLYMPNIQVVVGRFVDASSNGTWLKAPSSIESLYNLLWQFSNKPITTVIVLIIFIINLLIFIFKKNNKNIPVAHKIVLTWFLFPFLFMFFISFWIPMFLDRYLIFVSMAFYLLIAVCSVNVINIPRYKWIVPSILILLFASTFNLNVSNKRHVKETVSKVIELKDKTTKVLICPQDFVLNFTYYYDISLFRDVGRTREKMINDLKHENIFAINSIQEVDINDSEKVIFLDAASEFTFPKNNILKTLMQNYKLKNIYKFYEIFYVYEFDNR